MLPGDFVIIGEGGGNLSGVRLPPPSPNPTPLLPKTFTFIESLFAAFPITTISIRAWFRKAVL